MANNHISLNTASSPRGPELRSLVTTGVAFRNAASQLAKSLPQYGADAAGYTAIESDFGLPAGKGQAVADLIGSVAAEARGEASGTFIAQLLDTLG